MIIPLTRGSAFSCNLHTEGELDGLLESDLTKPDDPESDGMDHDGFDDLDDFSAACTCTGPRRLWHATRV